MSVITKYTCDKCGHEQTKGDDPRRMHQLQLVLKGFTGTGFYGSITPAPADIIWCNECCVKHNLLAVSVNQVPLTPTERVNLALQELIDAGIDQYMEEKG